jgi:3-oxochol-4-en-24-oyl-CoA dehydrogenase
VDDFDLTSELLRDSAVAFFTGQAGSARLRGWIAKARPVDRALWRAAAELGWTGLLLPESMGGSGLGLAEAALLAEEAGRHLFAEPLVAAAVMPALLLAAAEHGAAPELAAELARVLAEGQRVLTVAWQEAPGQLDVAMPACEVVDGRLSGSKHFVPACEPDGVLLVWAQHGGEHAWVRVDAQAEGVQRSVEAAGLGGHATLRFDRVRLNDDSLLLCGDAAQRARLRMLAGGRLALAAELVGLASGGLALALAHVRSRQQFGRALGSFQSVQHRCVDLHMEVELARASLRQALMLFDAPPGHADARPIDAAICAAKARAGEAAVRVGRESVQLLGAMGFCDEVDAGLYLRAALQGNAWLGGPVALRRRFAASLADQTSPMLEALHD